MSELTLSEHETLDRLEDAMLATGEVVEQPVEHLFVPGLYVRRIFNPAGSLIATKIHRTEHVYALLSGHLRVWTPAGVVELRAPALGVTKPGTRRVILAVEDSVFVTFHPNPDDERDLEILEERLVDSRRGGKSFREWRRLVATRCDRLGGHAPKEATVMTKLGVYGEAGSETHRLALRLVRVGDQINLVAVDPATGDQPFRGTILEICSDGTIRRRRVNRIFGFSLDEQDRVQVR